MECYDSFSNRWTEVAPLKEAVSSPAVTSCVGKLFVIGGGPDDNTCSDKVSCVLLTEGRRWPVRGELARSPSVRDLLKMVCCPVPRGKHWISSRHSDTIIQPDLYCRLQDLNAT